jgi:DnaJ-domain-containing protein 1
MPHELVLKRIRDHPGTTREQLARLFGLSGYRLRKMLRRLAEEKPGTAFVDDCDHGLWVVDLECGRCVGMHWAGVDSGGYVQCSGKPAFADGCCSEHSQCESMEMTAFRRELAYRTGPCRPTPFNLGQAGAVVLEELTCSLASVKPLTAQEASAKKEMLAALKSALALVRWKELMRSRNREDRIPPELKGRHSGSSVNPFEYSARRHFAVLEVSPAASRAEVVKAWRALARRYHPDTPDGDEEMMKAVNLAKERIFRLRRWD